MEEMIIRDATLLSRIIMSRWYVLYHHCVILNPHVLINCIDQRWTIRCKLVKARNVVMNPSSSVASRSAAVMAQFRADKAEAEAKHLQKKQDEVLAAEQLVKAKAAKEEERKSRLEATIKTRVDDHIRKARI